MKHKNRVGRPRLKPDYDRTSEIEDLIFTAVSLFNLPYDDRLPRDEDAPSLNEVAEEMEITTVKARKLLISGGVYSTELSRKVQEMERAGMRIEEMLRHLCGQCYCLDTVLREEFLEIFHSLS